MKKLLFSLLFTTILLTSCDFFVDPVAYNDKLVTIDKKAIDVYDNYSDIANNTPTGGDFAALDKKREEAIAQINTFKTELNAVGDLKGDADLRNAFAADFDVMIEILQDDNKQLIEVWKRMGTAKTPSTEDSALEDKILNRIQEKSDKSFESVKTIQDSFAVKHGYDIEAE